MQLGRYEILETIGQGASSSVSKARDTLIGRTVALKILHTGFHGSEWRDRFLREAHIVGQLSHPRIVNIYDAGIDEASGAPFLVMEFITGHTLEEILVEGTPLPDRLFSWGIGLARALDYAHSQGVIHGDVKPANVLINEDGRVKLTDFGIARLATQATHSGRLMGTPAYLAPEQIEGGGADARSDLFSLGIILYQLATGHRPFQGDSLPAVCAQILKAVPAPPSRLNPLLPRQLDAALAQCLAKDPARRFARAEELAAELESIAAPASATATTARRKKSAPFLRGYVFASSLAILALSVSLVRGYARNVLRVPPPPAAVFAEPKPPSEFPSTAVPIPAEDLSSKEASHAPPVSRKAHRKTAQVSLPMPLPVVSGPDTARAAVPAKVSSSEPGPSEASRKSAVTQLTVAIVTKSSDDTLVILADRQVLVSFNLAGAHGDDASPIRRTFALPPGPHQISVALYKEDKTLRSQKDGLAELRAGEPSVLVIHVGKHSKILPLFGSALGVTWPSKSASRGAQRVPRG